MAKFYTVEHDAAPFMALIRAHDAFEGGERFEWVEAIRNFNKLEA